MNTRKLGQGLIGLGIAGIVLSVLVDILPGAKSGIQAAQILGIEVSTVILLAGIWIFPAKNSEEINVGRRLLDFFNQMLKLPLLIWVMVGFLITYVSFFIYPMFLNATQRMHYFINYLPDKYPIGNDMIVMIDLAKGWFFQGQSPYPIQFYPPLTYIFYAPFLLVSDYAVLFLLFTFIALTSYFILTFVIPVKISGQENKPLILLFFITGLISYGFQFEIERGQYNIFTFLLCISSVYIYHHHPKKRIFSYLLFSLSVHLKIFPAIFIVMLVDNQQNWKNNILRLAGIGVFNIIPLFAMGPTVFLGFMNSVFTQLATPGWGWNGNHSIKAFVGNLAKDGFGIIEANALIFVQQNSGLISNILLGVVLVCVLSGGMIYYLKEERGVDGYLLLICTIAALTIPISNDYTLSILAAPMAIFLAKFAENWNSRNRVLHILLTVILAFAYSSLLIPFKYKPYFMNNAFPPLFLILILAATLNAISYFSANRKVGSRPSVVQP